MFRRTDVIAEEAPPVETEHRLAEDRTVDAAMPPWSPLQFIGLIVGIGFGILGIAAISRTGFDTSHIYTPHETVWTFPHSPLLGVIEIGLGLLLVLGSVVPGGWRSFLGFLGAVSLAFGIVVLTESGPNRLDDWLAVTHRSGWLFAVTGAVVLVASLLSPIYGGARRRHRVVQSDRVVG